MKNKTIYRTVVSIFFCYLSSFVCSQNMVPNGDFEDYYSIPTAPAQWYDCVGWSNINGITTAGPTVGSPDYFHTSGGWSVNLPNAGGFGTVNPYSGDAIMGFSTWGLLANFREYLSTQLLTPMIIGAQYNVSFWITNGLSDYNYGYSSDHIGITFSDWPLTQVGSAPIGGTPQFEIPGVFWSNSWQNISFDYVADSDYSYLTIGNFYDDAMTSSQQEVNTTLVGAYYFIDKVEITPKFQILGDSIICTGESVTLQGIGDTTYAWADSEAPSNIISSDQFLTITPIQSTTYLLYGTDDTISFNVEVIQIQQNILGSDTVLCSGETLMLDATTDGADYLWQDSSENPIFIANSSGFYTVQIEIENCLETDTIFIELIECESQIAMPNVFTPNDDGINDIFRPVTLKGITSIQTNIFNRWGNVVYSTENPLIEWDGGNSEDGTYYWTINYLDLNGKKRNLHGFVTLVK